jgi:hypothetical protein
MVIINNCRSKPCLCYENFAALYKHNSNVAWTVNGVSIVRMVCNSYLHNLDYFHMERQP